ncbi:hypothetical protein MRX96_050568 [Rhipicephalus microplus]
MCEMKAQQTPEQGTTEKSLRQLRCRRFVTHVVAHIAQSFLLLVKKFFIDRVVSAFDDGSDINTRFYLKFHKRTFEVDPEKDQRIPDVDSI